MERRSDTHPSVEILQAFSLGKLDTATAESVVLHLQHCGDCRQAVAVLPGDFILAQSGEGRSPDDTPTPGQALARNAGTVRPIPTLPNTPSPSDIPPELTGHSQYEVLRELGPSGMGVVYLARHRLSGRQEVLKVMNKQWLAHKESRERFLREIQSAAMLDHPNVVKMYCGQNRIAGRATSQGPPSGSVSGKKQIE
jgi:hypothetical protein